MALPTDIEIHDRDELRALERLRGRVVDMTPVMTGIAAELASQTAASPPKGKAGVSLSSRISPGWYEPEAVQTGPSPIRAIGVPAQTWRPLSCILSFLHEPPLVQASSSTDLSPRLSLHTASAKQVVSR